MSQRTSLYFILTDSTIPLNALAVSGNVAVYGVANVSYAFISTGASTVGVQGTRTNKVSSNASRFGLKGAEKLNYEFTATWQIESLVSLENADRRPSRPE